MLLGPDGKPLRLKAPKMRGKTHATRDYVVETFPGRTAQFFLDCVQPKGFLDNQLATHALWYFIGCAVESVATVENQVNLVGEHSAEASLSQVAKTTAWLYNISLEDMFSRRSIQLVTLQASHVKLHIPPQIMSWINSGGQTYDKQQRKGITGAHS